MIAQAAGVIYAIVKAVPAANELFTKVLDLYYDAIFSSMGDERNDIKSQRRALSNSIENAQTNEDRKHLSVLKHELDVRLSDGYQQGTR